ncbi:hypothetical protein LPJ56_004856 [Coemansia sp. RSA 2599]|nr:hypothetical protein LPJ75_004744 [Coemansia sp. RSA 2598]KAJ1814432.1 hypothetical protein LPJ56_004856 [Coemansia sp. RSA 2599]
MIFWTKCQGILLLATLCLGACENPASFKKCLAQTRAEVNICGINMTCKCVRQESVVKCYDKCGDDSHYMRLKEGEKGQQQIFCSQKRPGEPEDMPIIGSDGPDEVPKKSGGAGDKKKAGAGEKSPGAGPVAAPAPPRPAAAPRKPDDDDDAVGARRGSGRGGGGGSVIRDADVDGAAGMRAAADIGSIAFALAAAAAAVGGTALL